MNSGRLWLALVVALFCLPLFVGLGRLDLENDEAIYSFAVDRILETGDWIEPKSSPNEDWAFLEKPPLKFWLVAAPIKAGLLPHNQFGLRFWDALFAGIAFGYVYAIGCRLIHPVCGAVAVLLLFVHWPLLFDHGVRTNNMESALLLAYCGGVWHFLAWAAQTPARPGARDTGTWHGVATGLYLVLGFMTKFIAVALLPLVLGVATLVKRDLRLKVVRAWRLWGLVGLLGFGLCAPWFVWAHVRYGLFFWDTILAQSIVTRFTAYLNPAHVQPWYYYVVNGYQRFDDTKAAGLVGAGLVVLIVQTFRRRSTEGLVVVLWFILPVALISLGTSKLYHYVYPFLPPAALAAGYLVALIVMLAPIPLSRAIRSASASVDRRWPRLVAVCRRPGVRPTLLTIAVAAAVVAVASLVYGSVRLNVGRSAIFRSSGVVRPLIVILMFGVLAGVGHRISRLVVALLVASALPLQGYRDTLPRLLADQHPLRAASECVLAMQARGGYPEGLYVDVPDELISHPMYYYFRRIRPWTRAQSADHSGIGQTLGDPAKWKPVLVHDTVYQDFMNAQVPRPASPPMVAFPDVVLLLPGPYAACSAAAGSDGSR